MFSKKLYSKNYSFISNNRFILLLLGLSFISHWYIFFDTKILNWGDWISFFNSQLSTIFSFNIYYSSFNLGTISAFPNNWVFYLIAYFLGLFGLTWDVFTRIIFLIPIVFFTPLFSFLLFRKIFKSDLIAFFSACIYSFNTLFLKLQLDWITYAFIWWVLPALFLSILNYLETKKNKYLIYNALLVFLGFVYELRIMILVLVFLSLFQIIHLIFDNESLRMRIKNNFYILISFFLGILGHAFWLIPLKFGNILDEVVNNVSASPFVSFYDLLGVLTLHTYNWSQNLVLENFIRQPIEFRHFLIPLVAIVGIINFKKLFKEKKDASYFIFFAISLIFFVFLGKQAFGPFKNFYNWAFYNVPLFNLYRESSKFLILIALSLAFFFGSGLFYIYKTIKKHSTKIAPFAVMIILFFSSVFNLQHFIDQKIGGMTKGNMINDDYIKLEKILSSDSNYYRILWMPTKPRFGFYSDHHPFLNAVDLTTIFKDITGFTLFDRSSPVSSQLLFLLQQNYSDQLLDDMSVKYVILPVVEKRFKKISATETQTVNEIYEHYGEKEYFINELNKLSYLKKIDINTNELVVYENENYRPHIYSDTGLNYYHTNASDFGDLSQNQNLYFNSGIEKQEYLLDNLDNIVIPVEANPDKLDLYTNNASLKDFKLKIPIKATFKIYLKKDSVLANNKNISIKIDSYVLEKDETGIDKEGWNYFNQIELSNGEHDFKLYIGDELINYINSGDIVLSAENLVKPIQTPQLEYKQINPTKYIVNVHQINESFPLIFSESFDPNWKIYIKPELAGQGTGKFISENNQGTIQNENLDSGKFYDLLFRKPILNDKHLLINGFANAWWIDINEIKNQKSKIKNYIQNPDGSIDFELIVEFQPQRLFYIGLFVSGITLLACVSYIIWNWQRRKKSLTKTKKGDEG